MASINSLMRSSGGTNSIYGNRNVISGLASGMDTEAMIENAVKGHKLKITNLEKQRSKVEWQQEAYRNIINKLSNFSLKYSNYTSSTNLSSPSFFNNAVEILTHGANASKVTATGKTSNAVQIDSVTSLANDARYTTTSSFKPSNTASQAVDIVGGSQTVGTLEGSLTLKYGTSELKITFNEGDVFTKPQDMVDAINKQLENQSIKSSSGEVKASERIQAVRVGNTICFKTVNNDAGNSFSVEHVDDNLNQKLGIKNVDGKFELSFAYKDFTTQKKVMDVVAEKGFDINVGGVKKTIKGPTQEEVNKASGKDADERYINALQAKIDEAFGANKLKVSDANGATAGIQLQFESVGKTQFSVHSQAEKLLGMEGGLASSFNLDKKLSDMLPAGSLDTDQDFMINGKAVAKVTKDTTLRELMDQINNNQDSDVKMSYSSFTNTFTFTAKDGGSAGKIDFGNSGLAVDIFGKVDTSSPNYTAGKDAEFQVTVNGVTETVTQGSNTINIDGLNVTLNETFTEGGPVSFTSKTDTDKIMNAIKDMVKEYNEMAMEIKKAYETLPQQNSRGETYDPLTDEERADMSETEIKRYEEKAKEGLLFGDRDLAHLYKGMTQALDVFGATGSDFQQLGITTTFKDGVTTLTIDEDQLRKTLETDPDKVKDAFTRKSSNGATPGGLMEGLVEQINKYGATTGADKGILVKKAGSPLAPTSIMQNDLQKKINDYDKQIDRMRDKIADQIDYYNRKFSALEQLIAQMNNQSSSLMGMMGGF